MPENVEREKKHIESENRLEREREREREEEEGIFLVTVSSVYEKYQKRKTLSSIYYDIRFFFGEHVILLICFHYSKLDIQSC